jgi:metal-dependent amidase/aminoacylase/carboxypeptidase family protein
MQLDMLSVRDDFCLDSSVIDETYQKYGASLRRLSLLIHEYKEIAFKEYNSATLLADFVEEAGFLVDRGIEMWTFRLCVIQQPSMEPLFRLSQSTCLK